MKIYKTVPILAAFLVLLAPNVFATSIDYVFEGTDAGGTGSATMTISIAGNTLTAILNNTSPTELDDLSGPNTPGISGFGLNIAPDLSLTSWVLTAYDSDLKATNLSDSAWVITKDKSLGNLDFNYYAENEPNKDSVTEALFNPDALSVSNTLPGGSNVTYFTEAVLTLVLDGDISSVADPFVRMKNVGNNGDGSLKLYGTVDGGGGGGAVPEPSTILLLGLGLVAFGWRGRKHAIDK